MLNGASERRGFSLVELLAVIAIMGVVCALLLPAVQSARENARGTQCKNQLRQLATAALAHEQARGHLPSGGWGYRWLGDPDQGLGKQQPGGWCYQVLPFIEQGPLYNRGAHLSDLAKRKELSLVAQTPVRLLNCPSRRKSSAYPFIHSVTLANIDRPDVVSRSDYAANIGDTAPGLFGAGPTSYEDAENGHFIWAEPERNGIVYRRSEVRISQVQDGTASTYLFAEKYLCARHYTDGVAKNDDQGMFFGYDRDNIRTTARGATPSRDQFSADYPDSFGSAHPSAFNAACCDSSIHSVSYKIDPELHRRLGNRSDGNQVQIP
jgi:prepilin-type N-terminal cleavage/methylation domain-containing protein